MKECAQKKHTRLGVKLERKEQARMWSQAKMDFGLIHSESALEQKSYPRTFCVDTQSIAGYELWGLVDYAELSPLTILCQGNALKKGERSEL